MNIYLLGAGGHAKVLCDTLSRLEYKISGYVDATPSSWLDAQYISNEQFNTMDISNHAIVIAFAGKTTQDLEKRLKLSQELKQRNAVLPVIIDPTAIISPSTKIMDGAQILVGSIVNAHTTVQSVAIINSKAVIEHDTQIGAGAHIAPNATVLGGSQIGACSIIGGGATIPPLSRVLEKTKMIMQTPFGDKIP